MNVNSNKGKYLENLINRTINYYLNIHLANIEKRNLPFKIIKKLSNGMFIGKLMAKSTVDYTGIYDKYHIEFEAKQTSSSIFDLHQIKNHQFYFLDETKKYGCLCFFIINFFDLDEFYLVNVQKLKEWVRINKRKRINNNEMKSIGTSLNIIYPGIIDLIVGIKKEFKI